MALSTRRERSQTKRKYRLHQPKWIDPFPSIPGTEPEKRIFEALMQAHIYFVYHGGSPKEVGQYSIGEKDHDIDFLLPEYRVIIDPFSPYFHSNDPKSIQRDIQKAALFSAAGYPTYHPWAIGLKPGTTMYLFSWDQAALTPNEKLNRSLPTVAGAEDYGSFAHGVALSGSVKGVTDLLRDIPEINAGPRYPLDDPQMVRDKAHPGYTLGSHLGTGANSVGLANKSRTIHKNVTIKRAIGRRR